jgi:hypothetical protein
MSKLGLHLLCWTLVACGSSGSQGSATGTSTNTNAPTETPTQTPTETPAPAEAPAPPPRVDPNTLDLTQLGALSEAELSTLQLQLSYMGPPVGPATKRVTYQIDGEHFGKREANAPEVARKTAGSFRQIVDAIGRHGIAAQPEVPDAGCDGGSTYELEAKAAGKSVRLRAYYCGDTVTGTLAGDIRAFIDDLEWLLPDATRTLPRPAK